MAICSLWTLSVQNGQLRMGLSKTVPVGLVETILKFRNIKNAPFLKGLHSDAQLKYVLHSDTHKPSLAILAQVQTAKY